ncbi:hypothetical protein K7W42_19140 [Deinococcus sp. HMF7604]|uniref:hypothetical protein n=1 Tax=Deinococcus betulae TaxID=2873312 RepID=UPI001CCBA68B|nr:hypothetical protein [Deinococcus betulae]MBZ9752957.1 hypothetical protein [Deinococcus betulae]
MSAAPEPTPIDLTAPMPRYFAGSEWLVSNLKYEKAPAPSPLGLRVADLLGELAHGIYHLPKGAKYRTNWGHSRYIEVTLENGYVTLGTVDADYLTRLVFLAHDYGLRVEIRPCNFRHLVLGFSQREVRTGAYHERCPTAEDALAAHRARYPAAGSTPNPETLRLMRQEGAEISLNYLRGYGFCAALNTGHIGNPHWAAEATGDTPQSALAALLADPKVQPEADA